MQKEATWCLFFGCGVKYVKLKKSSLVPSDYVPLFHASGERCEGENLHVLSCGTHTGME